MVSTILKQAAEILRKRKENRRWQNVFLCLAVVAAAGTVTILMTTGQALTRQGKILDCQLEVHEHTENCYNQEGELICGYADFVIHEHNDDCYDADGKLVCKLPEIELHEHDESCYEEQEVLSDEEVGRTESEKETDIKMVEKQDTSASETASISSDNESSENSNSDASESSNSDGGGDSAEVRTCGKDEHTHGDGCYETKSCDKEEHSHDDSCYDENGELICGKSEHTHDDNCEGKTLICGKDEHTHSGECYSIKSGSEGGTKNEAEAVAETGDADNGTEAGAETGDTENEAEAATEAGDAENGTEAGAETGDTENEAEAATEAGDAENEAEAAAETDSTENDSMESEKETAETERVLICEKPDQGLHTHIQKTKEDGGCYDSSAFDEKTGEFIEGSLPICGLLQLKEHVHTKECFTKDVLQKEFTGDLESGKVHVVVSYSEEAEIPDKAELRVEQITEKTDEKLYRQRVEAAEDITEWPEAAGKQLYFVGFYMGEEEIRPKEAVDIEFTLYQKGIKEDNLLDTVSFDEEEAEVQEDIRMTEEEDEGLSIDITDVSTGEFLFFTDGLKGKFHKEFTGEYADGTLRVVAAYGRDAEIAKETELIVEAITEESDEKAYREKAESAKEIAGYKEASAEMLFDIGFFVNNKEIEPKGTVEIEFRLFKNGIEEGEPVRVIHFGDDETKLLKSTNISENENGSLSTSFKSSSFSPFMIIVGGEEERLIGRIVGEQKVYEETNRESEFYDLKEYEPALEEEVRIEIVETLTDEEGEEWYCYKALTDDEKLEKLLRDYPYIPAKDVELEGKFTRQRLTATDDEGVVVTVEGLLPEGAKLTPNRIYDPEIADVIDIMDYNMDGEGDFGDFRLVYDMDLGTDLELLEPVDVTVSGYDFSYDDYSNLSAWVYSISAQGDENFTAASADMTEKDDPVEAEVEKIDAEVEEDGTIAFQVKCLSTLYIGSTLIEGHDEYFNSFAESGDTLRWEDVRYFLEAEKEAELERETVETAEEGVLEEETEESVVSTPRRAMSRAAAKASDSSGQISNKGGENNNATDKVTTSKTIAATDQENVFDITLKVTAPVTTEDVIDSDIAVVIVMDVSNTMTYGFKNNAAPGDGDKSRRSVAVTAARQFINEFYSECGSKGNKTSRIGMVTFNTNSQQTFALQTCSTTTKRDELKDKVTTGVNNIINANGYGSSNTRYTNIESGLKRAHDMLENCNNKNKFIILVTDGFPTTYIKNNYTGYEPITTGTYNGSTSDGIFSDRVNKKNCLYGTNYSDKGAKRAAAEATRIKNDKIEIYSVGVALGQQSVKSFIDACKNSGHATVDITSSTYAVGNTADSYKNWLRDTIGSGSGHYADGNSPDALKDAFTNIFAKVVKYQKTTSQTVKTVTDPVPSTKNIEFIGFYDKNGALKGQTTNLSGSHASKGENQATISSDKISWDLQKSGFTSAKSGNVTTYTYTLKYRVRLKNEAGNFSEGAIYNTNGTTTLNYSTDVTTRVNGKDSTVSTKKSINFKIPSVKGYLTKLQFHKVDSTGEPVAGATFTLTHDPTRCKACRGNKSSVPNNLFQSNNLTAVSDKDGNVVFNEKIPSGHIYILTEEAMLGYLPLEETYLVKVAYDVNTVTKVVDGKEEAVDPSDFTVINENIYELPETGGSGVSGYTEMGTVLAFLVIAFYFGYWKKRELKGKNTAK